MATLYELKDNYKRLSDMEEEFDPALFHDTLDSIEGAINDKAENYAKVDANMSSDIEQLKNLIAKLQKRKKSITRNQVLLRTALHESMSEMGIKTIHTPFATITANDKMKVALIYDDKDLLPASYYKNKPTPDEALIKHDLENGKEIPGVHTVETPSMTIR